MRLFDAKSSHWAIRHIYVIMTAVGSVMLALLYPVGGHLSNILDNSLFSLTYVRLVAFVWWSLLVVGSGLLVISAVLVIGYLLIRRSHTLKLKDSIVD